MSEPLFGLEAYHLALATLGVGIIVAFWIPRFFSGREPAASALLILLGAAIFAIVPGMAQAWDPREATKLWERLSELAVIVALFGTGLRIDRLTDYKRWQPTIRLLVFAMPFTIFLVAALGYWWAGMTIAGAVLLGAVLAPTDPVLAGDVQVGRPTEGGEHPVRFTLTTEAGLNDGLAFPFVYLGLLIGAQGFDFADLVGEWFLRDVLYRIIAGTLAGAAVGWLLGRILFVFPRKNPLADTGSGILSLAVVLVAYGVTELVEGYGFIAAFICGLALRRVEKQHDFHGKLHSFTEAIEHALTAFLLLLIGGVLWTLWPELDWTYAGIPIALILMIRPAVGWLTLMRTDLRGRARFVVGAYGVRGIGSIYYLAYATSHLDFINVGQLWATIALTILLSTIVHGLTANAAVERVEKMKNRGVWPPRPANRVPRRA